MSNIVLQSILNNSGVYDIMIFDFPNGVSQLECILRLLAACFFGAMIGFERSRRQKAAQGFPLKSLPPFELGLGGRLTAPRYHIRMPPLTGILCLCHRSDPAP